MSARMLSAPLRIGLADVLQITGELILRLLSAYGNSIYLQQRKGDRVEWPDCIDDDRSLIALNANGCALGRFGRDKRTAPQKDARQQKESANHGAENDTTQPV